MATRDGYKAIMNTQKNKRTYICFLFKLVIELCMKYDMCRWNIKCHFSNNFIFINVSFTKHVHCHNMPIKHEMHNEF